MNGTSTSVRKGSLEVICGCMFSGKSERLVRRVHDARAKGVPVAAFTHASDDRYGVSHIATHTGQLLDAVGVSKARDLLEHVGPARLVAIDEVQFFDDELVDVSRELIEQGRHVIVSGLDRDAWGLPFDPIPALVEMADKVTRTVAVCARCGAPATFTQRVAPIVGRSMIGGSEAYEARCKACFESPPAELRR